MYIPLLYLIGCGQTEVEEDTPNSSEKTEVTSPENSEEKSEKNQEAKLSEKNIDEKINDDKTESLNEKEETTEQKPKEEKTEGTSIKSLITLERLGNIPALNIPEIQKLEGSSCHYSIDMKRSKIYSTFRMKRWGAALASPLLISYDGKALQHVAPKDIQKSTNEKTCDGIYSFPAKEIVISSSEENIDTSKLSVGLRTEFPFEQFESDFWWIYTKTQLRVILMESKDLYEKEVKVNVQLRKMGGAKEVPHLLVNKERYEFTFDEESNIFTFSEPFSISSSAFVIYTVVPSGCSDMLIEDFSLTIDDQKHSVLNKESVKVSN